jgi:hypothetical protein
MFSVVQLVKLAFGVFMGLGAMFGVRKCMWKSAAENLLGKHGVDKTDCYFDPECHSKVDWKKVGEMKQRFFTALKTMEEKKDVAGGEALLLRMHAGIAQAGVPEDRIDYILTKWVEYIYPQLLDSHSKANITISGFGCPNGYGQHINQEYVYHGTTKDGRPVYRGATTPGRYIYYDSYCADDTREPRWLLGGEPDMSRKFDLNTKDGKGCENDFSILSTSKHLPGGQQKVKWNWCGDYGLLDSVSISVIYEIKGKAKAMNREFSVPEQKQKSEDDDETRSLARWYASHWSQETPKKMVGTKCKGCLAEGMDYCISTDLCVPRATFSCHGPKDHITGDKEFALHGNPEGIQHSMVCPSNEANKKAFLAMSETEEWKMCSIAKLRCFKDGEKNLEGKCGSIWEECGKEVEAHKKASPSASETDEWKMCSIAKLRCFKDGEKNLEGQCEHLCDL